MKPNLFKKAVSFFIVTTICFTAFGLTGCNKSAKVKSFNRVCVQGSLKGTSFNRCANTIQNGSLFQTLNYDSNQIFTMKPSKKENNYYLKTVGSLLSEEIQQNHVFDFDYIDNDLVTLEFTDPNISGIEGKIFNFPFLYTIDNKAIGGPSLIDSSIVLYPLIGKSITLLELTDVYSIEVLDNKYLAILCCEMLKTDSDNKYETILKIYSIDNLLEEDKEPLFEEIYLNSKQNFNLCNMSSNKKSLLYTLTLLDVLTVYEITNDKVKILQQQKVTADEGHGENNTFLVESLQDSSYIAVWQCYKAKEDEKYMPIQIINTETLNVIDSVDPPKEGYIPSYVIPYNIDDSKGFFLFYENKETEETTSTYVEVS